MTDPTAAPQGEDDSPSIANVLALADRAGLWYPLQNDEQGIYGRARVAEFARSIWQAALAAERDRLTAEVAALREAGIQKEHLSLNVRHPDCHKAADEFWSYWKENGETHRHGYYESTWGAINCALRTVGVIENKYAKAATAAIDAARKEPPWVDLDSGEQRVTPRPPPHKRPPPFAKGHT